MDLFDAFFFFFFLSLLRLCKCLAPKRLVRSNTWRTLRCVSSSMSSSSDELGGGLLDPFFEVDL